MKRPLLITIGIVIILLVLGVWVYLMLFGTPKEGGDVFTNLGFDLNSRDIVVTNTDSGESEYIVNINSSRLRQLTTRPVAGFVDTEIASSSVVRYAERGTGHIYEINLTNGEERLISQTTIPRVQEAYFSPDGTAVVLVSITGYIKDTFVGIINTDEQKLTGESLSPNAQNIVIIDKDTVQYTLANATGLIAYSYNFQAGSQRELFRLPVKDIRVLWDEDTTKVYNKPALSLKGYLYDIRNGTYKTTSLSGYNFIAESGSDYIAYGSSKENKHSSYFLSKNDKQVFPSPVMFIPEKCTFYGAETMWCATPISGALTSSISDWYKGVSVSKDLLWKINITGEEAVLELDLLKESGRPIDVTNLEKSNTQDGLLFLNKIDATLWIYSLQF